MVERSDLLEILAQVFAALQYITAVLIVIGLFGASAGMVVELAPATYLSGLFPGLVMCAYHFVMVVLAVEIKTR